MNHVSFHHEMCGLNVFGIGLAVCLVNTIISIKEYFLNLLMISFNKLLKCTSTMILNTLKTLQFQMQYVMCDV